MKKSVTFSPRDKLPVDAIAAVTLAIAALCAALEAAAAAALDTASETKAPEENEDDNNGFCCAGVGELDEKPDNRPAAEAGRPPNNGESF